MFKQSVRSQEPNVDEMQSSPEKGDRGSGGVARRTDSADSAGGSRVEPSTESDADRGEGQVARGVPVDEPDERDECDEYWALRAAETADELRRSLSAAATRDERLARLLRVRVARTTGRRDRDRQATLDALAETRGELAQNNGLVAAVAERVRGRLGGFADGLRSAGGGDDDDGDAAADAARTAAANERLARVLRTGRAALERVSDDVRRVERRLRRKLLDVGRIEERAAAAIEAADRTRGTSSASDRAARSPLPPPPSSASSSSSECDSSETT